MNFGKWLSQQLNELKLNPNSFSREAEKVGVSGVNQPTVKRIIGGETPNPGEKVMRNIGGAIKLIRKSKGLPDIEASLVEPNPPSIEPGPEIKGQVPLISWVQAGNWGGVIDNLAAGDGERIETSAHIKEHTYALRVRGDSMEPKFPDGAILIVEPDEDPMPGKYVIVRQNGDSEATFKQLVKDGDHLYLKPLNSRYPILELRKDAVFCGVVKRVEMDV